MILCGIDEAGRGPLAGPLVMAGVVLKEEITGLRDSKRLSAKKREALFLRIIAQSHYHIVSFDAQKIDEIGISACLHQGLKAIQHHLPNYHYLFDGNSSFGVAHITTMVKADAKVDAVSAASIIAKVTRDSAMEAFATLYPHYGFERHKGYGTKAHIEALKRYGRSPIHRKSFNIKGVDDATLF